MTCYSLHVTVTNKTRACQCRSFMARPIFSTDDPNVDKHKLERFLHEKRQCLATIYGPIQYPPLPLLAFRITPDQPPQLALAGILVVLSLHLTCLNSWDVQPSIALHIQCIENRGLHASNDCMNLASEKPAQPVLQPFSTNLFWRRHFAQL